MMLPSTLEFEDWRAEPERNVLVSRDGETRIGSRAMAVLVMLAGNGGRVVTRPELLDQVWEGRAVTDDALTVAVHDLRKALGDRPNNPRYVETIQGRGYRWLVPIERTATPSDSPPTLLSEPELKAGADAGSEPPPPRRLWPLKRWQPVLAGLTLGALGVLAILAVGMEHDLQVPGKTLMAGPPADSSCGINPELPQDAQESYSRGVEAARTLTPEGFRRAVAHFEKAVEQAPHFSLAYGHLADALLNLSYFPKDEAGEDRAELSLRARAAVREALALDPTLPSSHLIRGIMRLFLDWDTEGAEQDFWQAIQLDSNYAQAHERYALVLVAKGQFAAAEVRLRHAADLVPANRLYAMTLADLLIQDDRPAEALDVLEPTDWEPPLLHHLWLTRGRALEALGRGDEACASDLEFLSRALPRLDSQPYQAACDSGGRAALHELWLDTLGESTNLLLRAIYNAEVGRVDQALDALWQMHRERDPLLLWSAHDRRFEPLHDHPEFERLLASVRAHDPEDPPSIPASSHPSWALRSP